MISLSPASIPWKLLPLLQSQYHNQAIGCESVTQLYSLQPRKIPHALLCYLQSTTGGWRAHYHFGDNLMFFHKLVAFCLVRLVWQNAQISEVYWGCTAWKSHLMCITKILNRQRPSNRLPWCRKRGGLHGFHLEEGTGWGNRVSLQVCCSNYPNYLLYSTNSLLNTGS